MTNKIQTVKTRILLKTATTSEWNSDENKNFIPLLGEACIYLDRIPMYNEENTTKENPDYYIPGIKIGDGETTIELLPFVSDEYILNEEIDEICGRII